MKKNSSLLLLVGSFFCLNLVFGQHKYIDKNGTITFEASEEVFEPVKATNTAVTMLLDTQTGQVAALALVKGFRFKNSLMEEHFNENYIESETYPKATFKGQIEGFNINSINENKIQLKVDGVLKLHGKEKQVSTLLKIQKIEDEIAIQGAFSVTPDEFDIEIPKVVRNKIAKEIQITLDFKLSKK